MRLILFTFVMAFTLGFAISDSVEFFDAYAQEGDSELSSRASSADKEKLKKVSCIGLALADPATKTYRVLNEKQRLFRSEKIAIKYGYESRNGSYQ